ncbi:DUF4271 domain-containing protein [Flavobacteriaceae bacterium]|nr:DUF4271 domain-containing protein [Flavobacteriaceae bacterium]
MLRDVVSNDWYVIFCLASLVIVVLAKTIHPQRFSAFLKLFGNTNYLRIYLREHSFFDRFDSLLFINFCVNLIVFGWMGYQHIFEPLDMSLLLFSQLFALVALGFLLKIGLELFLGYVLDLSKLFNILTFQQISSYNFIGLILLPLNAFNVFGVNSAPFFSVLTSIFILLILLAGMTKTIRSNLNMLLNNFFYFILYLCTLEIGPFYVLFKVLNRD